jgi:hypothetical protein
LYLKVAEPLKLAVGTKVIAAPALAWVATPLVPEPGTSTTQPRGDRGGLGVGVVGDEARDGDRDGGVFVAADREGVSDGHRGIVVEASR